MNWLEGIRKKRAIKNITTLSKTAKNSEFSLEILDLCHLEHISTTITEINKRYPSLMWTFDTLLPGIINEAEIAASMAKVDPATFITEILFMGLYPVLKKSEPEGCSINVDWCKKELNTLLLAERDSKKTVAKFVENVSKSFDVAYNGYDKALKNRESEANELWEQVKLEGISINLFAALHIFDESIIIKNIAARLISGEEPTKIKKETLALVSKLIEQSDYKKKELFKSSFADQHVRSSSAGTI